jgi:phosphatidylglycerophosphate synthase
MNLKALNIAEWFAFSRVLAFPIVILLILLKKREITAWFYIIMFTTDFIDGFFAYFFNMEGKRRAQLDTMGDVLFILAGILGFFIFDREFFIDHLFWILAVAFLYLIQLLISLYRFGQPSLFHTYMAKIATAAQVVFLCHMFFFSASGFLFYLAIAFSILEIIEEAYMIVKIKQYKENVKGFWAMDEKEEGN